MTPIALGLNDAHAWDARRPTGQGLRERRLERGRLDDLRNGKRLSERDVLLPDQLVVQPATHVVQRDRPRHAEHDDQVAVRGLDVDRGHARDGTDVGAGGAIGGEAGGRHGGGGGGDGPGEGAGVVVVGRSGDAPAGRGCGQRRGGGEGGN